MSDPADDDSHPPESSWNPMRSADFVLSNLLSAGNLERVEREAKRFLEIDPEDCDAHYYLTLAAIDLAKVDLARQHLGFLLSREPEELRTQIAAACFYAKIEDWRRLREHVHAGLRLNSDNAFLYRLAAIADLKELKLDQAKHHISRARQLDPDDADIAHLHIRIHGAGESDATSALRQLDQYRKALALDPANAAVHNSMGDVYLDDLDDPAEAEIHYREALRFDPGDRDYQRDLFNAVAKRSLIYRLFSIPSRAFAWLKLLGYTIRYQPWRLIFLVIGFKLVIAYFCWLFIATALFWPGCKVYEWLLVSEIKAGADASISELRAWHWIRRWPVWVRFSAFLLANAAIWGAIFYLLGVSLATGYAFVGVVTGIHFALVVALWLVKRLSAASAKRAARRRKTPPPLPKQGPA
jgi:tetratricopeptide (TPR) repeat protein